MRGSDNDLVRPYGKAIRLVIGLFCTESFDYQALITGKLKTTYHLERHDIKKLNVKGKLEVLKQEAALRPYLLRSWKPASGPAAIPARISPQYVLISRPVQSGALQDQRR